MKSKQNVRHSSSQSKLTSLLQKSPLNENEELKLDQRILMTNKVVLPDVIKQNSNSPFRAASLSKDSILAFVAANNLKKSFQSKTPSLLNQFIINEPSIALQSSARINGLGGLGIDMSEIGSNTDFQTTMYSSMASNNKKKELGKLLLFPKDQIGVYKIPKKQTQSNRNSIEMDLPPSKNSSIERSTQYQQRIQEIQDNYKRALDTFFDALNKNRALQKPVKPRKKIAGAFRSQPQSPVSKKSELNESPELKPHKPLIKPPDGPKIISPKLGESISSNRAGKNLKKSLSSNKNQTKDENLKDSQPEIDNKISRQPSEENILNSKKDLIESPGLSSIEPGRKSSSSKPELPISDSLTTNKPNYHHQDTADTKATQDTQTKDLNEPFQARPLLLKQDHPLITQLTELTTKMNTTNPVSHQIEIPKVNIIEVNKQPPQGSLEDLGALPLENTKSENLHKSHPERKFRKSLQNLLLEKAPSQNLQTKTSKVIQKDKNAEDPKFIRRSSYSEVFALVQQRQAKKNESFKDLNVFSNQFPDMLAKITELETMAANSKNRKATTKKETKIEETKPEKPENNVAAPKVEVNKMDQRDLSPKSPVDIYPNQDPKLYISLDPSLPPSPENQISLNEDNKLNQDLFIPGSPRSNLKIEIGTPANAGSPPKTQKGERDISPPKITSPKLDFLTLDFNYLSPSHLMKRPVMNKQGLTHEEKNDIKRFRKISASAAFGGQTNDEFNLSPSDDLLSSDNGRRRKISKTEVSSNVPSIFSNRDPISPDAQVAEEFIIAAKKVSFLTKKENSIRELSLLRSIIKDNQNNISKKDNVLKRASFMLGGPSKLKIQVEDKDKDIKDIKDIKDEKDNNILTAKSERSSPVFQGPSRITQSLTNLKLRQRKSSQPKKLFDRTYTQKSLFARKGEFKKINLRQFAVAFPSKAEQAKPNTKLKFSFNSKDKNVKIQKTNLPKKNLNIYKRDEYSNTFLHNLKEINADLIRGSHAPQLQNFKTENFIGPDGPERQKTIDFSTLLQNDDDDSLKAFPLRSVSRTGSMRSDLSKIIQIPQTKEIPSLKFTIKIMAPSSDESLSVKQKEAEDSNEEHNRTPKKFEFSTKSRAKKNIENDIDFSPFENTMEIDQGEYNVDVFMGDMQNIILAPLYNWADHGRYFSKSEQYGQFLKYFEHLIRKKHPFLYKYYDDAIPRYETTIEPEDGKPYKQLVNKKIIQRITLPGPVALPDVYRHEDDLDKIRAFNMELLKQDFANMENEFVDDLHFYGINSTLQDFRDIIMSHPQAFKLTRSKQTHKHIISQIDDRVQIKLFESTRHTIEDYIMLNGVNMKEISRKEPQKETTQILQKTSRMNLDYISKLFFRGYKEHLTGKLQCMLFIKVIDRPLPENFREDFNPIQKVLLATRKIFRRPGQKRGSISGRRNSGLSVGSKKRNSISKHPTDIGLIAGKSISKILSKENVDSEKSIESSKISLQRKSTKSNILGLEQYRDEMKPISAPVSPEREADLTPNLKRSRKDLRAIISNCAAPFDNIFSNNNISTMNGVSSKAQLMRNPSISNHSHVSRMPSKFKQVVKEVIKKKNKEKMRTMSVMFASLSRSRDEKDGKSIITQTPRKTNLIKFDHNKFSNIEETKMDKGALRNRTQVKTFSKKSNLTLLQQIFMAVKENREIEVREFFAFVPLSVLDKTDENGDNLMGIAAQCGFSDTVDLLLTKGANVNIQNADGDTPLHLALAYGNYNIADKLLASGALQTIPNKNGKFPWDVAN